ncbi:MAG: pilus assembly protein PilP [Gammaproteobacteria bacterium]
MITPSKRCCGILTGLLICLPLAGCGGDKLDDLRSYVQEVKARPKGKIEPLPQIQPQETFAYSAATLRDPFSPPAQEAPPPTVNKFIPDINRQKEVLEEYPLDGLKMVGTVESNGETWSLVRAPDGIIYRVKPNNYLGQNYGKIVSISEESIELIETIEDGQGGWLERPASLVLSENK